MERSRIEQTIRSIVQSALENPKVDIATVSEYDDLFSYGLNSISFVKIVVGIEEEYEFEFEDEILVGQGFNTLNSFIEYTMNKEKGGVV